MNVNFDPESIVTGIDMWRKALDLQIALSPEIRSHLLTKRRPILKGYVTVAQSYSFMLGRMEPTDRDSAQQLQIVKEAVQSFQTWAKDGLDELDQLERE